MRAPTRLPAADADALVDAMRCYAPLGDETVTALLRLCRPVSLEKDGYYCRAGDTPTEFGFVAVGLLRAFVGTPEGAEYNKIFFDERTFPGSMAALLRGHPSRFSIQALEPTRLVSIEFAGYRELLATRPDLMWFQIRYLEENWLLAKEMREVALVQADAAARYARFLDDHPALAKRLPLYHIASHLGITPTQLSRVRRALS